MNMARQPFSYRPFWAGGVSFLAHLAVLTALVVAAAPPSPAPVLPQIELLPPLPAQPAPQDARPSPLNLPIATKPSPPGAFSPAVPASNPPPVIAGPSKDDAQPAPPKPHIKPREKLRPQPIPTKATEHSKAPPTMAASIRQNGNKTEDKTVIAEHSNSSTPAGPPPSYLGMIQARLLQVKQYPEDARAHHQEGIATMQFTIDRAGRVLSLHLDHGSGVRSLDIEATEMIARASPFPPMPSSITGPTLSLVVPIEFSLKAP